MAAGAETSLRPLRKPLLSYMTWRLVLLGGVASWVYLFFLHGPGPLRSTVGLVAALLLFAAVFIALNLGAFKLPYSVIGPLKRTAAPPEAAICSVHSVGRIGTIASTRGPFATYTVYTSGLSVSMLGIGAAFIPFACVDRIDDAPFGRRVLIHHSPEVRSPILLPEPQLVARLALLSGEFGSSPKA